jgi:hypothetical protein
MFSLNPAPIAALALLSPLTGHSAPLPMISPPDQVVDCGTGGSGIQSAIDRADDGARIRIRGRCRESFRIIRRNLELFGETGAVLEAPDSPPPSHPETGLHPLILILHSEVKLTGITLEGRELADLPGYSGLTGIHFLNSSGEIRKCKLNAFKHRERQSDWSVTPIRVVSGEPRPDSRRKNRLLIEDTQIENFESNAIFVSSVGRSPSGKDQLEVKIRGNRIRGGGPMIQNQNGIQIGGYETGKRASLRVTVENNQIEALYSYSGIWASSGILVAPFNASDRSEPRGFKVRIDSNVVLGANIGLSVETSGKLQIRKNLIEGGDTGARLRGADLKFTGNRLLNLESGIDWDGAADSHAEILDRNSFHAVKLLFQNASDPSPIETRPRGGRGLEL